MTSDLRRLRHLAWLGFCLYAMTAAADALLTQAGLNGQPSMEGNPFVRWTMGRIGIGWALLLEKAAVGLACAFIALRAAPAIHRGDNWIWKVPMLPPVRRWMKSGDRSWIALIPLYGMVLAQACAVGAWLRLIWAGYP